MMQQWIYGLLVWLPIFCKSFFFFFEGVNFKKTWRLTGFLPFYDKNHVVLFEKIQNVDYNWDDCPEVSPAGKFLLNKDWFNKWKFFKKKKKAKHFIQHLLVKDPVQRYTAAKALNHPWVKVTFDFSR